MQRIWSSAGGGVVDCTTGWGKSETIAKLVLSYPRLPVTVVAPGLEALRNIRKRLAGYNIETGWVDGSHNIRKRVNVVSANSLMKYDSDGSLANTRLLLFDEVHLAPGESIRVPLGRAVRAKRIGFSASMEGRSDRGEILIEALFGPVICRVDYEESVAAGSVVPTVVIMMQTRGRRSQYQQPTSRTREVIWNNQERNEDFAMVARQIVEMGQVLMVTQTLQHAINVQQFLPDWSTVYASLPSTALPQSREPTAAERRAAARAADMLRAMEYQGVERLTAARRTQLYEQFVAGELRGVIATGTWGKAVDFPKLQFVMRLSAQGSEINAEQEAGRGSRISEGKHVNIVIDGEDDFDPAMTRRKQERIRVYRSHGWKVLRKKSPSEVAMLCRNILAQQLPLT